MKTLFSILALFTLVGVQAQEPEEDERGPRHHRRMMRNHHNPFKDMTPEQTAEIKAKKLTLALDLSDSQQKKVQSLIEDETARIQAKHEERKELREKEEKPSANERHANMVAGLDERIEFKRKMKDVLDDEQYLKWTQIQEDKHKKRKRFLRHRAKRRR